ncbi:MAG: hypothetical protein IPN88_15195 [Bacteroidetes bacterium]|nr:hypothetical protein [Bacteroidota bacterium]
MIHEQSITFGEEHMSFLKKAEGGYCPKLILGLQEVEMIFHLNFDSNQSPVYNLTSAEKSLLSENSPVRFD